MLEILLLFVGLGSITAILIGRFSAIESGDYTYRKNSKRK